MEASFARSGASLRRLTCGGVLLRRTGRSCVCYCLRVSAVLVLSMAECGLFYAAPPEHAPPRVEQDPKLNFIVERKKKEAPNVSQCG